MVEVEHWISELTGADQVKKVEAVQELWSGYGSIDRWLCTSAKGSQTFILKRIEPPAVASHPRGWNTDASHQRKLRSYHVEKTWYQDWSHLCGEGAKVAKFIGAKLTGDGQWLLMEDLDSSGYYQRFDADREWKIEACLTWLAGFHGQFLHCQPKGLWEEGAYWHLQTRQDEWNAMPEGLLKAGAYPIAQRLAHARFRTLVHGDAKVANFCFNPTIKSVAAVDFQYVGGGVGVKDVAYFLGSCLTDEECESRSYRLLEYYFSALESVLAPILPSSDLSDLVSEWRALFPLAWADFHRFLVGWMPGHSKINRFTVENTERVLASL